MDRIFYSLTSIITASILFKASASAVVAAVISELTYEIFQHVSIFYLQQKISLLIEFLFIFLLDNKEFFSINHAFFHMIKKITTKNKSGKQIKK